jgi:hypothetical protein
MKIKNWKITTQYWADFPARGLALLACPSGIVVTARPMWSPRGGYERGDAVAQPVQRRQRPRCSAIGGVSTRTARGSRRVRRIALRLTKGVERR